MLYSNYKNLVTSAPNLKEIPLSPEPFFSFDFTIQDYPFKFKSYSYFDGITFITITINNTPLCLQTIARLGVNLCYNPILTLDNKQHCFFLASPDDTLQSVTYQDFGKSANLYYTQTPYYA